MRIPENIKDIRGLISDEIAESLHLEYKASPALSKKNKDEICKDVSSFANADGGVLVYGVLEREHIPYEIDKGVPNDGIDREWIDQIISYNITPPIEGIRIVRIDRDESHSVYALSIPKSFRGPHQAPDKKYYKRYNFRSSPMDHYELEDIRNRKVALPSLVNIDIEGHGIIFKLVIENVGAHVAHDLTFHFSDGFKWPKDPKPPALTKGIKYFPPGRKLRYFYASSIEAFKGERNIATEFDIHITYMHSQTNTKLNDTFHFDLIDYYGSSIEKDPLNEIASALANLSDLKRVLQEHNQHMKSLSSIATPTGINLSITSLRNLQYLMAKGEHFPFVPFDIRECDYDVIKEVLSVNTDMAFQIYYYIHHNETKKELKDIDGMTDELIEKIHRYLKTEK